MTSVRALYKFHVPSTMPGQPARLVNVGDVFDAKDKIVKGRDHLFEPIDGPKPNRKKTTVVERATAAPGELRTVPKKDTADAPEVI